MIATQPTAATPLPGESYEDFVVRAHGLLQHYIADPMERNQAVWTAWESANGDTERQRAEQYFGDGYVHKYNVPVWQEHEAVIQGPDGQPMVRKNDVNRLKSIIQENNLRIADTDAYTALVDKHTIPPGAPDKHVEKPKTVGFVGPYRLGMVGRIQPRFAVFADEHHYEAAAQTLKDRPRRSVEVLTLSANGRSYFDPIAALSEAPRLPLPVQAYSANDAKLGEITVERYEGVEAASPTPAYAGGTNTYIPGAKRREQFAAPVQPTATPERKPMLESNDIKQIIDAMLQTPQMQFVAQLMQQSGQAPDASLGQPGQQPGQAPGQPPAPAPHAAPPHGAPAGGPPAQREQFTPTMPPSMGMPAMRYSAIDSEFDEVNAEQYQALADQYETLSESYAAISEQNEKLAKAQEALMGQVAQLHQSNAQLHAVAADAERKSKISELYQAYPHFVDVQAEETACLYSAGSQMTDDDFAAHLGMLERYAAKVPPVSRMIPGGELPQRQRPSVETERYEAQVSQKAVEIYTAKLDSGEVLNYEQCYALAEQELKSSAA